MSNSLSQDIIKEWGLQSLPPEKQQEMVERIGRLLYQAVLVNSLDILSEKEQTEMDMLLDKDATTPEDVLKFLQAKIPTFNQLVLEERTKLKDEVLIVKS